MSSQFFNILACCARQHGSIKNSVENEESYECLTWTFNL